MKPFEVDVLLQKENTHAEKGGKLDSLRMLLEEQDEEEYRQNLTQEIEVTVR